jgi:hypothetical protein
MTGEGEVSGLRYIWSMAACGEGDAAAGAPTANDAGLQRSLVARLRRALLFAYLFEVVVDEGPRPLGDGSGHLLQTGRHGGQRLRGESLGREWT